MLRPKVVARSAIFGIEACEVRVDRRGFRVTSPAAGSRIETIGRAFVHGYECALNAERIEDARSGLGLVRPELSGFAFEGAAMAFTLLDEIGFGRASRWQTFLEGCGNPHAYMLYVGAGWAFARLPRGRHRLERFVGRSDPLLRWLAIDGYGFHHGFFGSKRALGGWRPQFSEPYAARAFDQGLGRSLWFVEGADVGRVAGRVRTFAADRRADLWSGVGLAAAYAGIVSDEDLRELRTLAGQALPAVQQGVAFAATARSRAVNTAEHTEQACQLLCGLSIRELSALVDEIRDDLGVTPAPSDYEVWRRSVSLATERAWTR